MAEDKNKTIALINKTGYNFSLKNGQRLYGPPSNWIGPPPKDTEIFIGKLPNDIYEYDLVPLFSTVGKIYMLRLMQNFSGLTRRFAFIQYSNPEEARKAIEVLNNVEIRPGEQIGVVKSRNNCRLYIGNLSTTLTKEEVFNKMKNLVNDVVGVSFNSTTYPEDDYFINKGYAFVEFNSHKAAALARRKLVPCKIVLNNQEITVDWATPITELGENLKVECTLLFKNFRDTLSNEEIYNYLSVRNKLKIIKLKRIFNQVLVSYESKHETELALKIFEHFKKSFKFFYFCDSSKKAELLPINDNMDLKKFKSSVDFNFEEINDIQPTTSRNLKEENSNEAFKNSVSTNQQNNICSQFNQLNINQTSCKKLDYKINKVDNVDSYLKIVQSDELKKAFNFSTSKHLYNQDNSNSVSNKNYDVPFGNWKNDDYYKSSKIEIFSKNTSANQNLEEAAFFDDFEKIFKENSEETSDNKLNNNEFPDFY